MLASKEDGLPYEIDPVTLETRGVWDAHDDITSLTFTAHPKFDSDTGEMFGFGYAAKGETTRDIAYYVIDASGKVIHEAWFEAPYSAMIHDCALTKNFMLFPVMPVTSDLDRLKAGGPHFVYDGDLPQVFGVIPRFGDASEVRWFQAPPAFPGHTINAYEEDGAIVFDLYEADGNGFAPVVPDKNGMPTPPGSVTTRHVRWHLKRVHLELGGNSALIVLDDVDVEKAASAGAFGSFHHAGQICMASSRHLVHASIAEEYVESLARRANAVTVGDPARSEVAVGHMIDEHQLQAAHAVVNDTVAAGARLVAGGTYEGLLYRPTVLADVPLTARAYREEIFGPVAPVVPFRDLDEAVRLATGTEYGLSLSVLTRDIAKGLALAERIPTGLVHINDQTVNDEATVPFGGRGDSGNGSRHGGATANLEAFTEQQWVTVRGDIPAYPF